MHSTRYRAQCLRSSQNICSSPLGLRCRKYLYALPFANSIYKVDRDIFLIGGRTTSCTLPVMHDVLRILLLSR